MEHEEKQKECGDEGKEKKSETKDKATFRREGSQQNHAKIEQQRSEEEGWKLTPISPGTLGDKTGKHHSQQKKPKKTACNSPTRRAVAKETRIAPYGSGPEGSTTREAQKEDLGGEKARAAGPKEESEMMPKDAQCGRTSTNHGAQGEKRHQEEQRQSLR